MAIVTGVNADGHREVLGVDVFTTEDGAGWIAFLRGLVARGLSGVALVISDAHVGLKNAIASVLPGACWQRCRTHAMRNLLARAPKAAQAMVATLVRTVFAQSDPDQVRAQFARVVDQLEGQFPAAAELLTDAESDLLAFATFPVEHWRQIWSNNTQVIYSHPEGVHDVVDGPLFRLSLCAGCGYLQPSSTQVRGRFGVRSTGGVARFAA